MKRKNNPALLVLLISAFTMLAQQKEIQLRGKVVSEGFGVPSITVMNLVNERVVATNADGEFSIPAKQDDLLIFSSVNYEYKRRIIEAADIERGTIEVTLVAKVTELDEVIVNRDINPEDLGLVPKGQKTYTPAERRLKQAGEFKPVAMIGMVAGLAIPVDPIINAITGRTKMLKKDVKTEQKEFRLARLRQLYDQEYYVKKLHIPSDYVLGFQYYAADDPELAAALNSSVKARIDFCMAGLAQKYNELLTSEPHQ